VELIILFIWYSGDKVSAVSEVIYLSNILYINKNMYALVNVNNRRKCGTIRILKINLNSKYNLLDISQVIFENAHYNFKLHNFKIKLIFFSNIQIKFTGVWADNIYKSTSTVLMHT